MGGGAWEGPRGMEPGVLLFGAFLWAGSLCDWAEPQDEGGGIGLINVLTKKNVYRM